MKCVRCGTELKEGDKICLGCGFEVGREYTPEINETLESLMQMPEEEPLNDTNENIEQMEIIGSKKENDTIDGEEIKLEDSIVGENEGKIKNKKNKKYLIFIVLFLIIIGIVIYFYLNKKEEIVEPEKPNNKINVVNHPTETYIYDNKFLFRLNDLWEKIDDNTYINNQSEFKIIKHELAKNTIEDYLDYINVESKEEREINNIKYYYIINNNQEEYVIVEKTQIYALTFTETTKEEINNILNTMKYYK